MSDKKRRISGEAYWKMNDLFEDIKTDQEDLQKWMKAKAKELKLYPDQPQFLSGAILDAIDCTTVIDRLPHEIVDEADARDAQLRAKRNKLSTMMKQLARRVGTFPDLIDPSTGEIRDGNIECVDPEKQDVAAPAADGAQALPAPRVVRPEDAGERRSPVEPEAVEA